MQRAHLAQSVIKGLVYDNPLLESQSVSRGPPAVAPPIKTLSPAWGAAAPTAPAQVHVRPESAVQARKAMTSGLLAATASPTAAGTSEEGRRAWLHDRVCDAVSQLDFSSEDIDDSDIHMLVFTMKDLV